MPKFSLILPAAGSSTRFGGTTSKLLSLLGGITVMERTLRAFLNHADVAAVVIPSRMSLNELSELFPSLFDAASDPRVTWCAGGESRAHSVRNGLRATPADVEWVAVHDAARPMISTNLIDRTLAAAIGYGAAVPALAVSLTIKQADGPLPARVQRTVPRHTLWSMQTPQIMRRADLFEAFESCPIPLEHVTDDVQLLELAGREVWLVAGEERNLKITTPIDMRMADALLVDMR